MLLYSDRITNRLEYIIEFFSGETSVAITMTTDKTRFTTEEGPKINYSPTPLSNHEVRVPPVAILLEKLILPQPLNSLQWREMPAFFPCANGDFGFDLFAASFYLLSRYEEYLPHRNNIYGCYAHEDSLAFKENFINRPVINEWVEEFKKVIVAKWPMFQFPAKRFSFIPTYDIDSAWSFKYKGVKRNLGSIARSLSKLDFKSVNTQISVLKNQQPDPFEAYEWIETQHKKYNQSPTYFFLLAKKQTGRDKNIPPDEKNFQELIRGLSQKFAIGIHPSWESGNDEQLLLEEKQLLEAITNKKVINSRQHYIRWNLPGSFRQLLEAGIENDYSMGYTTINGFRASVASPFFWYDLPAETVTPLKLWPFCFMDSTAIFEEELTEEEASKQLNGYVDAIKKINGLMITIWHNCYLGTDERFKRWKEIYEQFLDKIRSI